MDYELVRGLHLPRRYARLVPIAGGALETQETNLQVTGYIRTPQLKLGVSGSEQSIGLGNVPLVAKVALAAVDTAGGIFAWVVPVAAIIRQVWLNITAAATGAITIDVGYQATGATTLSDNLLDGIDGHTAAGLFTLADQAGANGLTRQLAAAGKWVTGSTASGASAGIAGFAYIEYIPL